MIPFAAGPSDTRAPEELRAGRLLLLHELRDRSLWFVHLRWWVPPIIWLGLVLARLLQVRMEWLTLALVSVGILAYNILFHLWHRRFPRDPDLQNEDSLRRFTRWQVLADFIAMFLFVHFTGGGSSPFVFFFIFHVIFASILLKHHTAHAFAVLAALGMGFFTLAEGAGWITHYPLRYRDQAVISLAGQVLPSLVVWGFFAGTVIASSFATTSIMEMVRRRILRLADLTEAMMQLNGRLRGLNTIVQAMVSRRHLDEVLAIVCRELASVMDIQGISVKLLAEDGRRLRYAASHGLPARFAPGREVDLDKSPLNRRIIEGEPYTAGHVTDGDLFQLGEEYAAARIKSVLFVPLRAGDRVIGILGAYARETDRFGADEQEFLRLAAELTAIALENARAYQAVEELGAERERFAYRVAHNLRAPLAAMVSMVDVLRDGYAGEMGEKQRQYLERIRARATALGSLVNELLVLASAQSGLREEPRAPVSLADVVASVFATFTEKCAERRLALSLDVEEGLPPIIGMATKLEQMLENLVSNAVKYTAPGGTVTIRLHGSDGDCTAPAGTSGHWLCLVVEDDGIGIPAAAQEKLFTEFYRAENARAMEAIGTGLGLVIVRDIARTHGGRVDLWSEEGRGTRFTVRLPVN